MIVLILDGDGKQVIVELCRLARDQEPSLIVRTTLSGPISSPLDIRR